MLAKLEDFKTGWFGLEVGLTDDDITALIERLTTLRKHKGHFHARSNFSGQGGIGDIEFYWADPSIPSGLVLE
jgi:hypothetical protein